MTHYTSNNKIIRNVNQVSFGQIYREEVTKLHIEDGRLYRVCFRQINHSPPNKYVFAKIKRYSLPLISTARYFACPQKPHDGIIVCYAYINSLTYR